MAQLAKNNIRKLKGSPLDTLAWEGIISQMEQYSVKSPKSIWLPDLKTGFENYQINWVLLIYVAFCWFFQRLVKYVLDYGICCFSIWIWQPRYLPYACPVTKYMCHHVTKHQSFQKTETWIHGAQGQTYCSLQRKGGVPSLDLGSWDILHHLNRCERRASWWFWFTRGTHSYRHLLTQPVVSDQLFKIRSGENFLWVCGFLYRQSKESLSEGGADLGVPQNPLGWGSLCLLA